MAPASSAVALASSAVPTRPTSAQDQTDPKLTDLRAPLRNAALGAVFARRVSEKRRGSCGLAQLSPTRHVHRVRDGASRSRLCPHAVALPCSARRPLTDVDRRTIPCPLNLRLQTRQCRRFAPNPYDSITNWAIGSKRKNMDTRKSNIALVRAAVIVS
jgi:hypothetical protein